ncbi:MAG: NAD(P)H-hydrate dehydratase [Herminiimonas sp.]|nr:NAD(P)H-hydrate dehydratase [Herminiimonas sp.]
MTNDFLTDDPIVVDTALLHQWPLPMPSGDSDKEGRGHVLVIGGSREMPGAVILAATAALRAGAGKLTVATGASVAQLVAQAIHESRVIGLPETDDGGIAPGCVDQFDALIGKVDAVLIGPGMQDEAATCAFVRALLPKFAEARIVLDAYAMGAVVGLVRGPKLTSHDKLFNLPILLTPHAGEMAHLTGVDKEAVLADGRQTVMRAAQLWNSVVALKGATTLIATPRGQVWQHSGGNLGLAISGSGDTLAGIIAGLAARGASLEQAGVWGVALHARAGDALAQRVGLLGYLAREIAGEVPSLMHALSVEQ